jgi:protein TonB
MPKSADKAVSLAELRLKRANSNSVARAVLAHQFVNVPRCSFAKDDGISPYLGAETGMDAAPASPDRQAPVGVDGPAIQGEVPETGGSGWRKLLRDGFALSVFLHAVAAVAMGYASLSLPKESQMEQGAISVTFITQGNDEADARSSGKGGEVTEEAEILPKVEEKPLAATSQQIFKDVPLPILAADLPEILTTQTESKVETEVVAKTPLVEEKVEQPAEDPKTAAVMEKPVEKKPESKKDEPKKRSDTQKPREEKKQKRGDQGDQAANAKKGDVESKDKGKTSTNSRGASDNRDVGNAARTNYRGLVNRKLSRAKGRMASPAKGNVIVTFTILANGTVSGLRIQKSSGKEAVDAAALKVVRAAAPFPPIPAETGKKTWPMTLPMTFKGK